MSEVSKHPKGAPLAYRGVEAAEKVKILTENGRIWKEEEQNEYFFKVRGGAKGGGKNWQRILAPLGPLYFGKKT